MNVYYLCCIKGSNMVLNHVRHSFWRCCWCWYFKKIETDSLFLIALLYNYSFAWMSPFDNKTSIFFIIFYFYPWSESYWQDLFLNKFINKLKWINLFVCFLYVKSKAVTFRVLCSQFFHFLTAFSETSEDLTIYAKWIQQYWI